MKIDVGTYVRILGGYTDDAALSGQTGVIEALPNKDYPDDYLVKLDGGPSKNIHFAGRMVRVPAEHLQITIPTWRV